MKCYVAMVIEGEVETPPKFFRQPESAENYRLQMQSEDNTVSILETDLRVVRLVKDVNPNIGLRAGRTLREYYDNEIPPRDNGEIWVEGDRVTRMRIDKYNKSALPEPVELPRYCILTPDEYEVVEA